MAWLDRLTRVPHTRAPRPPHGNHAGPQRPTPTHRGACDTAACELPCIGAPSTVSCQLSSAVCRSSAQVSRGLARGRRRSEYHHSSGASLSVRVCLQAHNLVSGARTDKPGNGFWVLAQSWRPNVFCAHLARLADCGCPKAARVAIGLQAASLYPQIVSPWWQVAPHGRSDGAQGAVRRSARDAHLCIVCATPFGSRPFS